MERLNVKELKNIARERGIRRYYRLRRAELIEVLNNQQPNNNNNNNNNNNTVVLGNQQPDNTERDLITFNDDDEVGNVWVDTNKPSSYILNQPIREINIPILQPSKPKNITTKAVKQVKSEINKFADWIISYIPEPVKKNVDERVNKLKEKVNSLYKIDDELTPKENKAAIKGYFKTYRVEGGVAGMGERVFINSARKGVLNLIKSKRPIKVKLILTARFYKKNPTTGNIDFIESYFHSKVEIITKATNLTDKYNTMTNLIFELVEIFTNNGSGWQFDRVEHLDININPFNPLSASSYIPLPSKLSKKKAIINVQNKNDNECFKWAVTSAVFPKEKNSGVLGKKMIKDSEKFDWTGIEFPVSLNQIDKFEKQNDRAINVYGYEKEVVYPLRISELSDKLGDNKVINLLLISNEETNHYCWIKNMSRLISDDVSNRHGKRYICYRCLNSFHSEKSLEKHKEYCQNNEEVKIEMPMVKDDEGEFLRPEYISFVNFYKKQRLPFVVYADLECFTEKISTCQPNDKKSFTNKYQKHKPSGFRYVIICLDNNIFSPKLVKYTSESVDDDIPQLFIESLEKEIKDIYSSFKYPKKIVMTKEDKKDFAEATHCHICEEEISEDANDDNYKKVRDHCHLTGKFRGAAHSICNLKYKLPKFYPVFFHNLSGYDSHIFIKNLGKSEGKINCIPNNEEKYISFTKEIIVDKFINEEGKEKEVKRDIRFIDSFKFMAASLGNLVKNLPKESFKILEKFYDGEQLELLLRKGVFPYDWFDSFDKLSSDHLPPIESFYSTLNESGISEEDYQHAQKVWKTFNMKTMRDYHDLYLETDVLLLADVFENFRDLCLENYHLDPAFYYTAPGLAWDACLKMTKVKLELLHDYNMLMMVEKGIRGESL